MIKYHLSFNTICDSADGKHPDVEVIDYQYGASGYSGTIANREMVSLGKTFKQDNVTITEITDQVDTSTAIGAMTDQK